MMMDSLKWHFVCPKCKYTTVSRDPNLETCPIPWGPDKESCGGEYDESGYAYYDELISAGWTVLDPFMGTGATYSTSEHQHE